MKRILIIAISLILIFSFAACQNTPDVPDTPDTPDVPDVPDTPDTPDTPDGTEPYTIDFSKDVMPLGRTYMSRNMFNFDWAGSGLEFRFKGTDVKATMGYLGKPSMAVEVTYYIDGARAGKTELSATATEYTLAEGLENTEHTVKIVKSAIQCTVGTFVSKIEITGEILAAPAAKERTILALGDSLSAGRAVLGDESAVASTRNIDDCTYATPWLVAEHFDADLELVADTGYGIYQSSGKSTDATIPKAWRCESYYTKKAYDYAKSNPDIIIINLGTNDVFASTPITVFKEYLTNFLNDVREKYPETPILYYYGMLKTDNLPIVKAVINERVNGGDENIYFLQVEKTTSHLDLGAMSCGHPTVGHYEYYAEVVEAKISEILGW